MRPAEIEEAPVAVAAVVVVVDCRMMEVGVALKAGIMTWDRSSFSCSPRWSSAFPSRHSWAEFRFDDVDSIDSSDSLETIDFISEMFDASNDFPTMNMARVRKRSALGMT